ncbi:hypothetical protein EV421DRAFT_1912582 [Armillaria borealis]|uniref:Cation efflux protein transmembrane domain-containing protein n=1 Tax=Armillaria borealis TaxID=47425 RepID=A0AA39IVV5_9AGAR|nr:hypothetical protein EV421DRAFT_1912582 [Armillaria borealis]
MTTFTVTKTSLFPLLVYILLSLACLPSNPSRFSSAQIYRIESVLQVQEPLLCEVQAEEPSHWENVDEGSTRIFGSWSNTSDTKDKDESARLWVEIAVWTNLISNLALYAIQMYVAISSVSLSLLATGIDSVFDIGSNVVLFRLHLKAEKLDMNKWPVSGSRLENIGNIVYGSLMTSVNLIVVAESMRSLVSKENDELKDFHIPSIITVAAALSVRLMLFLLCYPFRKKPSQVAVLWEDHRNDLWINTSAMMGCTEERRAPRNENGYKIILFKLERLPGQLPVWTRGKFWAYPESDAPTKMPKMPKMPEPSAPKKSLFPTRPKLPSFNKSSTSLYTLPANWQQRARLSPVPAVKVEKYCDEALQYPVTIPLLQYPEVDVETRHSISVRASTNPPLCIKDESPPPTHKRSGSSLRSSSPQTPESVHCSVHQSRVPATL